MSKPVKPYPSYPLTPHVRGGWGKHYKGRQLYIPHRDPDEALAEFHRRARAIDAGREPDPPSPSTGAATVGEVCNRYAAERAKDCDAGTLSHGALQDYRDAATLMGRHLGPDTLVDDLTPAHFTRLYRHLVGTGLGKHALARTIQCMRTIWNHADANDWIERKPKFGTVFRKPTTDHKSGTAPTPEQIRAVVAAAAGQLRAMIMLGVNCAYTAKDCAALPRSAVDLDRALVRFPRPKMRNRKPIDRACTLWPETVDALRVVLAERPDDDLVFRTAHGRPWVRDGFSKAGPGGKGGKGGHVNSVGLMYRRVCAAAGVDADSFADLRHVFRTVADELEKPNAAARIMGHRLPGLAQVYVDRIEHPRLQQITDYVRDKVFLGWATPSPRTAPARPAPPTAAAPARPPSRPSRKSR